MLGKDSQFFSTHVTLRKKDGMSKVAYHRLLVGGRRGKTRQTLTQDRAIPKTTAVQLRTREMQCNCLHSMCSVQRSSMEAKALNVLKGCFAYGGLWTLVSQARVDVCSGRAGGSERHLLFFARYVETCPPPHPPLPLSVLGKLNTQGYIHTCRIPCDANSILFDDPDGAEHSVRLPKGKALVPYWDVFWTNLQVVKWLLPKIVAVVDAMVFTMNTSVASFLICFWSVMALPD